MNDIKIVTFPDQLFNDSVELLLLYPSTSLLTELQTTFFRDFTNEVNIYMFNSDTYAGDEVEWLLSIIKGVGRIVVDIDNTPPFFQPMLSYIIGKNKTYWLTSTEDIVYNHISTQRIYNLDSLTTLGE